MHAGGSPPHTVDLVTCIELIEHLPPEDQPPLLRQFRSWLRTDGILVLSSPQRHSPVAFLDKLEARHKGMEYDWWDPTHISVLPRHRLEALLTGAGFDILNRCGVCFAPDAFAVRSRTCRRLRHASTTGMMARYGWNLIYTCRAV